MPHGDIRIAIKLGSQNGQQAPVQFDCRHVSGGLCQPARQVPQAGTDFHDVVCRSDRRRTDNAVEYLFIPEEILPEALFRMISVVGEQLFGVHGCIVARRPTPGERGQPVPAFRRAGDWRTAASFPRLTVGQVAGSISGLSACVGAAISGRFAAPVNHFQEHSHQHNMLPLRDANPTRHTPYVTISLIVINVLIFLFEVMLDLGGQLGPFIARWGFVPALLQSDPSQAGVTILTGMFLHGGWLHLGGNMLYLWIFGDNVEDRLGRGRFLLFYLLTGAIAALAQWAIEPDSIVPVVGASGAIAGVLGGYLLLFPRAQVLTAVFVVIFYAVRPLPAVLVLGRLVCGPAVSGHAQFAGRRGSLRRRRLFCPPRWVCRRLFAGKGV